MTPWTDDTHRAALRIWCDALIHSGGRMPLTRGSRWFGLDMQSDLIAAGFAETRGDFLHITEAGWRHAGRRGPFRFAPDYAPPIATYHVPRWRSPLECAEIVENPPEIRHYPGGFLIFSQSLEVS